MFETYSSYIISAYLIAAIFMTCFSLHTIKQHKKIKAKVAHQKSKRNSSQDR